MRFQFEASDKGKIRKGHLQAADREQAFWTLESKGLQVHNLQAVPDEGVRPVSRGTWLSLAVFGLGLLAGLWSFFQAGSSDSDNLGQTSMVLEVDGLLSGPLGTVDRIQVNFPQLPARLEGVWSEVGQADGRYRIRRELKTLASPPAYFSVSVLDAQGQVLARAERAVIDPTSGRATAPALTIVESP